MNCKRLFSGSGLLNLLGMTMAFAALYILLVQVYYDLGYNKKIKDADRIYAMTVPSWFKDGSYQMGMNRPLAHAIASQAAQVENFGVTRIDLDSKSSIFVQDHEFKIGVSELTRGALDVFSFTPIAGTFDGMEKEATVAISERASHLMGIGVGDNIQFQKGGTPFTVVAVYEDMPMNSDFDNVELFFCDELEDKGMEDWSEWGYYHYVKLHSPADKKAFEESVFKLAEKAIREYFSANLVNISEEEEGEIQDYIKRCQVRLFPLDEFYFCKNLENKAGRSGNRTTTITLLTIAILILLITLINFINFFFAQVPMLIRGINTRKILGSSRCRLVGNLMAESGLLVSLSLCTAVAVVLVFKSSTYANLISCSLAFPDNLPAIIITIAAALIMTIASSVYPALYLTSFSPALAIKGTIGAQGKGKSFRYALIAFQFIISLSFVICTFCLRNQHRYMMDYDMGFNRDYLLVSDVSAGNSSARATIVDELLKSPHINDAAWGAGMLVNNNRMSWGRSLRDHVISFDAYPVSWNFLRFMGIEILEGRDFTSSDEQCENGIFIFNQVAKNQFGLTLEDKIHGHSGPTEIAGFCQDFRYKPLQYSLSPFAFYVFGKDPWWEPNHLYLRCAASASVQEVRAALQDVVLKLAPDYPVDKLKVDFFDSELGYLYQKEQNLTRMVTLFSLLAIIISLMGVLGLVIFETQYRRKEIGVRRIHGASIGEILQMFNLKFARLLAICFIIAAPISWIIVDYYYSSFAYHAPITLWTFVLALLLVSAIVFSVVTLGSLKAATENPVLSLKSE